MSCDCPKCDCKTNNSSSFIFGIILGAIVGAIIAIVIYRQSKGKIFDDLQKKLEDFFKDLIGSKVPTKSRPKPKTPITVESKSKEIVFIKKPAPKTFIKPKK